MASRSDTRPRKEETLFERLKLMRSCPVCTAAYQGSEGHVLEETSESALVHMTCQSCRSALLALVVTSALGMSSVYVMTDLSVMDTIRLRDAQSVAQDHVLDFHLYLQQPYAFEERMKEL